MHLFSSKCPPSVPVCLPGAGRCDAFCYLECQLSFCAGAAASDSTARRDRMLLHLHLGQARDLLPIIRRKGEETVSNGVLLPKLPTCLKGSPRVSFCCPLQRARSRLTPAGAAPGRSLPAQHPAASGAVLREAASPRRSDCDGGCHGEFRLPAGRGLRWAAPSPPPHVTPPGPKMAAGRPAHSRRGHRARLQDGGQWRPPETA